MNAAALGLIAAGGVLLFYLLHSHYAKLSGSSGGGSPTSSGGGGGTSTTSSSDIGSHMGLDANGNTVVIHSTYAGMTDQQKDSANAFARRYPSGL